VKSILKKSVIRTVIGTGLILLVPFGFRWPWTGSDFVVAGIMLLVGGMLLNLVVIKVNKYKIPVALVVVFLFLWLWMELAVGLFTNWGS
jgi:hypothetical protein